jgi:hypothetical protein
MWRIRTNLELKEIYKCIDIVADIKKKRLEWIGHLVRVDHGRVVKKYFRVNWMEEEGEEQDCDS